MVCKDEDSSPCYSFILLGKRGSGKSATGNTILGRKAFISKNRSASVTQEVQEEHATVCKVPVVVHDTPGFFNTEMNDEVIMNKCQNLIRSCELKSEICTYLLVVKANRFTEEDRKTVEKIEKLLGEDRMKKTMILFTKGDELEEENQTIEIFIDETPELKQLVQRYENRYHVFNNKIKGSCDQVENLLKRVNRNLLSQAPHLQRNKNYKTETREASSSSTTSQKNTMHLLTQSKPCVTRTEAGQRVSVSSSTSQKKRRIVLLGKSGHGKSASGNTILGSECFKSECSMISVTSRSELRQASVRDSHVSVVDTPGLFDTSDNTEELGKEIAECISLSSPGPHAFLIVLPLNSKFTSQEKVIIQIIKALFGEEVMKYTIILFTHGDQVKVQNIDQYIKRNKALKEVVDECGGGYHIFNNEDQHNRAQVTELLEKVDRIVEENGATYYTNQMFQDAATFKKEMEERVMREEAERKERESKQKLEEIEKVKRETEERIKNECEEKMKKSTLELQSLKLQVEEYQYLNVTTTARPSTSSSTPTEPTSCPSFWEKYKKWFLSALGGIFGFVAGILVGAFYGARVGASVSGNVDGNVSAKLAVSRVVDRVVYGVACGVVGGVTGAVAGAAAGSHAGENSGVAGAEVIADVIGGMATGMAAGRDAGAAASTKAAAAVVMATAPPVNALPTSVAAGPVSVVNNVPIP